MHKIDPRSTIADHIPAELIERITARMDRQLTQINRPRTRRGLRGDTLAWIVDLIQGELDEMDALDAAEQLAQPVASAPESRDEAPRTLEAPALKSRAEAPGTSRDRTADALLRILFDLYGTPDGLYSTFELWLDALVLGIIAAKRGELEVLVGGRGVPLSEYFDDVLSRIPCPRTQTVREADGSAIAAPAPSSPRADRPADQDVVDQDVVDQDAPAQDPPAKAPGTITTFQGVEIRVGVMHPRGGYVHCRPRRLIIAEARDIGIPDEVIHHKDLMTGRQKPSATAYKTAEALIVQVKAAQERGEDPAPLWARWVPARAAATKSAKPTSAKPVAAKPTGKPRTRRA